MKFHKAAVMYVLRRIDADDTLAVQTSSGREFCALSDPRAYFFLFFFQMKKSRKTAAFQRLLFRFLVKIQVTPAGFKGSLRSTSAEAEIFSALTRCATPDPSR